MQTVLIGIGGTGSRVVNKVVKELNKNKIPFNDGSGICCAVLDTDSTDNGRISGSGSGVPVIPTSGDQTVEYYWKRYTDGHHDNVDIESWCPESKSFMATNMMNGASEKRIKSRIAFMDTIESPDGLSRLENLLSDVIDSTANVNIRAMVISSLSGGTGSGMFIQLALWLRKRLGDNAIIRGMFLLPDIFVRSCRNIGQDEEKKQSHYANAYAAIRELNAISKVLKGRNVELEDKIRIGEGDVLFDSDASSHAKPVYDYAFFIDAIDDRRVVLQSLNEYEAWVAQMAYMQLFAPMTKEMMSVEDNFFSKYDSSEEPLYGSCGAAKAVYPFENVKEYCTLRASAQCIQDGWQRIDQEIASLKSEQEAREKEDDYSQPPIDPREKYIELYERYTRADREFGKDRFFKSIQHDSQNEKGTSSAPEYSDKIDDYLGSQLKIIVENYVKELNQKTELKTGVKGLCTCDKNSGDYRSRDGDDSKAYIERLKRMVDVDQKKIQASVDFFDSDDCFKRCVDTIMSHVFPLYMGDVLASDPSSVYGLLTKTKVGSDRSVFIHPVAARYVLTKLLQKLKKGLVSDKFLEEKKEEALTGKSRKGSADAGVKDKPNSRYDFNNSRTRKPEKTPVEYLESKALFQSMDRFVDYFKKQYTQYINNKINVCLEYESAKLCNAVCRKLSDLVEKLLKKFEVFFQNLPEIQADLQEKCKENVNALAREPKKLIHVCASEECKKYIYQTLDLDTGDATVNEAVTTALYGSLCAEERENAADNQKYRNSSIGDIFLAKMQNSFDAQIMRVENADKIDLDIFEAIVLQASLQDSSGKARVGAPVPPDKADAFKTIVGLLESKAAPFLPGTADIEVDTSKKTFWGYNRILTDHIDVGKVVGANDDLAANDAYPKNELLCYVGLYGLRADRVGKFCERPEGIYYKSYRKTIEKMLKALREGQGESAYVMTPHLDKTWHNILPYINADVQKEEKKRFYFGFWLAVAYRRIVVDKKGKVCFDRADPDNGVSQLEKIMDEHGEIDYTLVGRLLRRLRRDRSLIETVLPDLEKKFEDELVNMRNYSGTGVMNGLTQKGELNPIDMIERYYTGTERDMGICGLLVDSLGDIALRLASGYKKRMGTDEENIDRSRYVVLQLIFRSRSLTKGDELFERWTSKFREYGLGTSDGEGTDGVSGAGKDFS